MPCLSSRRRVLTGLACLPFAVGPALAGEPEICAPGGVALGGHDPVAYWTEGRATPGDPGHALVWRRATWRFQNAGTLATFEMDPARYAPAYGGWCAMALAHGAVAPSDPAVFALWQDRLFLVASPRARRAWAADATALVAAADAIWPQVLEKG